MIAICDALHCEAIVNWVFRDVLLYNMSNMESRSSEIFGLICKMMKQLGDIFKQFKKKTRLTEEFSIWLYIVKMLLPRKFSTLEKMEEETVMVLPVLAFLESAVGLVV